MGPAFRTLTRTASSLRPLMAAVRGVERESALTPLTLVDGSPFATRRLAEILDVRAVGAPAGADGPLVCAVADDHDPTLPVAALAGAKRAGRRVLVLVVGDHATRAALEHAVLAHDPLELSNVVHVVHLGDERAVRATLAAVLGGAGLGVARAHPVLRDEVADVLIGQASRQAGAIGAAVILPGADLPVITIVQVRLVARLAALYGRPLDVRRAAEIAGVIAGAFGWRALARRAVASVPVAGFALRAGVAYSGTRAVGEASKTYFAGLGDRADLPLQGLSSALNSALAKRKGNA